jgi:hypothetical protein
VEFYEFLLRSLSTVQHQVVLATLYIGTGEQEQRMLSALDMACQRPGVQATIVADALRSQRIERSSGMSSLQMIQKLCGDHVDDSLSVHLYHTHLLGRMLHAILPGQPTHAHRTAMRVRLNPNSQSAGMKVFRSSIARRMFSTMMYLLVVQI